MDVTHAERFTAEACASPILGRLDAMARELAGAMLVVYLRSRDRVLALYPAATPGSFPEFCDVIRETLEGRRHCATCRSLVTLGACYRGMLEYRCHGGISIVAAPALRPDGTPSRSVAVAACAFAQEDRREGWAATREDSRPLGVDLVALRRAYNHLPVLTSERLRLAKSIVGVTAAAVGEIRRSAAGRPGRPIDGPDNGAGDSLLDVLERDLSAALYLSRDRAPDNEEGQGSSLVEHVRLMVCRDPELPYSVAGIAKAARITPNHFSALFRKHTGRTFVSFVREERLRLAQELLRDLTLNVSEVAQRCGFSDPGYFTRCFRKYVGATPGRWRQALGGKAPRRRSISRRR
jgi:AraC-like DNA-binding protein